MPESGFMQVPCGGGCFKFKFKIVQHISYTVQYLYTVYRVFINDIVAYDYRKYSVGFEKLTKLVKYFIFFIDQVEEGHSFKNIF